MDGGETPLVPRRPPPSPAPRPRAPVEQPRLAAALDERREVVLAPGASLESVLLLGGAVRDDEAADVDVVGSRLVGSG